MEIGFCTGINVSANQGTGYEQNFHQVAVVYRIQGPLGVQCPAMYQLKT